MPDVLDALRFTTPPHYVLVSGWLNGFGTPDQHFDRVADLGMSAMAITEHGNVSSYVQAEKAARRTGLKFIPGLEAYCAPEDMRDQGNRRKWHLTLLAMNLEGYRNLMRLVSLSWAEGFYQWPTIMGSWLKEYNEGIICLSGCADSKLACDLLGGKGRETGSERDARRTLDRFRSIFGDRYYLETQQFPELARTHQINQWLGAESRRTGVPLVATSDCHYPFPDDNKMQVILHAAGRGIGNVDTAESQWEYDIRLTPPDSDARIIKRLQGTGLSKLQAQGSVDNTALIASRCDVELPKMPMLTYPLPRDVKSKDDLIWDWLREGWKFRWSRNANMRANKKQYHDRLMYEMGMITSKGYIDYFLMLADALRWTKMRGIAVGPARGSAAASLACYLLRITEIDPIPFPNMLFERFIDINRTDLPDVDLDFDDDRRYELTEHMTELYGEDCVANVLTLTKYRGKNSLDDVARVNDIPPWVIQPLKGLMIERSGGDSRADAALEDTVEMFPQAKAIMEEHPALWAATRLEGNYKSQSVHAAGLIIANEPLADNVAVCTREVKNPETGEKERHSVLSVDKYDAEYMGLLKADFLGLKTMGAVSRACSMIGMNLDDLYEVPLDEPDLIKAFNINDVTGIFQFGGGATKIVNGDVKPDSFLELCDINALSRPGPLHSGTTNDYINVKHGRAEPEHFHDVIDELTQYTQHQIIYQEQILQVLREVGGLPWTHIQEIRKIISLKKGVGAFEQRHGDFIDGSRAKHNIKPELADRIWRRLVTAGQYAFNASHCVSYSMLAYWTMYLKVRHPHAFYASHLAKFKDDEYTLLRDAIAHDLKILPPDVNESEVTWVGSRSGHLRGGFQQVPGVGKVVGPQIAKWRDEQEDDVLTWRDLQQIKGIGPKTCEKFEEMALSDDPYGIYKVDRVLNKVRKAISDGELGIMPQPTHRGAEIPTDADNLKVVYIGIPHKRNPQDVIEDERARTGDDYDVVRARMKDAHLSKKMVITCYDDTDTQVYVRFWRQSFPKFEKGAWSITLDHDVVVIAGVKKGGFGTGIHVRRMWVIDPDELEDEE